MEIADVLKINFEHMDEAQNECVDRGIQEVCEVLEGIRGANILDWYLSKGTASMKGLSRAVNDLILQGLEDRGWTIPWSFARISSQQANFDGGKVFVVDGHDFPVVLDIGSRHRQSSLAYLVRPSLAFSQRGGESRVSGGAILLAFTRKTTEWGMWNNANSTFELFLNEIALVQNLSNVPLCVIGVDPEPNLSVSKNLDYGGLNLDVSQSKNNCRL